MNRKKTFASRLVSPNRDDFLLTNVDSEDQVSCLKEHV